MTQNTDPNDTPDTPPKNPRRWGHRHPLWWWLRGLMLLVLAPFVMVLIAAVLLIGNEVSAPSWVLRDVEHRASEVLAGGSIGFGALKVTIGPDLHPQLVAQDAVLRDAEGGVLARVPRIQGVVSPRGVLQGRVLVQQIRLSGAQISLRRARDGTVALAFDQDATAIGGADGFLGLLDQIDTVFDEGALEALEQVSADGLIINYVDARAGQSWVMDGGRVDLDVRDGELQLRANVALLSGRAYVTTADLTYTSPRGSRMAQLGVSITDAAAPDIASQSPLLSWLGVLDAPISGAMRGQLDEDGGLASMSATLQIGAGELRPNSQTRPIPFDSMRTYLNYDPLAERLTFDLFEVDSALGRVTGSGRTYLREFQDGWPLALLGQLDFAEITLVPQMLLERPVSLSNGSIDFRLRLDPFTLDIGQAVVLNDDIPMRMNGLVSAEADGWSVALNADAARLDVAQVLSFWPPNLSPGARAWLAGNLRSGDVINPNLAFRATTHTPLSIALSMELRDAEIGVLSSLPPIIGAGGVLSIIDRRVAFALDTGHIAAPQGGLIDLAGSTMVIPVSGIPNAPARFDLALQGRLTAAMAILNLPPFRVLRSSDLPVSFAQGLARITVALDTPLGGGISPDRRVWSARADIRDVRSDALIPNRLITSSRLQVLADAESLMVRGPMQLGDVGAAVVFSRALGAGSDGTARVTADMTISPAVLRSFNINLPDGMVTGETLAQIAIDLSDPAVPGFRLTSDLRGAGLSLARVGWSKARDAIGALTIVGQLGATPRIEQVSITAPGFQTTGTVQLAQGGGLERAAFERVRLGDWLDAPVVLLGRGAGQPVQVQIAGGSLDLRLANLADSGGAGNSSVEGPPMDIALDSLRLTDSIEIRDFRGVFTAPDGVQGQFQGNVNGAAAIRGTLVAIDGQSAVRIVSDDAGGLLRATGLLRNAHDGTMQLTLIPTGEDGTYDGTLSASTVRLRDAPALANLLDAISVVGLLTQMDGQGILFRDIEAKFRLTPDGVIVTESSAIGPGLGISLDGMYWQGAGLLDFQGVVSPFYILNQVGSVLTRRGEGLIGFNFNLRGPVDNPQVSINPLSALTPGMFRDIFRRPPPTLDP